MRGAPQSFSEPVQVITLRRPDDLLPIREPWNRLFEESPAASPPLRWDWVWNWWRVFGADAGRQLHILTVHREGRIVGLLPLYRRRTALARRLTFVSAGLAEFEETCAEHLNLLCPAGEEDFCIRAIALRLCDERNAWEELELADLPEGSPLLRLPEFMPPSWRIVRQPCGECYAADLSAGFDNYIQSLSPKARAEARRLLRQAEHPRLRFELAVDAPTAKTFFDQLVRLHHDRWRRVGRRGSFAPRHADFHRSLTVALTPGGHVLLARLSADDGPLALVVAHRVGPKLDVYQQGAVRECHLLRSPGTVTNLLLMREAERRGIRCVDQLKGANDLKDRYFRIRQPLMRMLIRRNNWRTGSMVLARWGSRATRKGIHLLRFRAAGAANGANGAGDER